MDERQSSHEQVALAQELFRRINDGTRAIANGEFDQINPLLSNLVSTGPDEGPEIRATRERLSFLTPNQRAAVNLLERYCGDYNSNFSWDSNQAQALAYGSPHRNVFFKHVSSVVQGMLNPESPFGENMRAHLIGAEEQYTSLINDVSRRMQ